MSDTRGPRAGKVPPHVAERLAEKRRKAEIRATRGAWWQRGPSVATFAVIALLIGLGIGIGLGSDPLTEAADTLTTGIVPLANEADAAWEVGVGGAPGVGQSVQQLGATDDPAVVVDNLDAWLATYDDVLERLDAVEVSAGGQGVADLFRASVALMRDGVETAGAAAAAEAGSRQQLLAEVALLRVRSLELLRDARTALEAIGGPPAPVTDVPAAPELTRPGVPATQPADDAGPEPDAEDAGEPDAGTPPEPGSS